MPVMAMKMEMEIAAHCRVHRSGARRAVTLVARLSVPPEALARWNRCRCR
jgi:hypothetical protein